ncbi:MAG: hypothetical protein E7478_05080 [Ruminococcaceae bacterium]|nr:hypothetical protein [Oscillospiraceae bacterium]
MNKQEFKSAYDKITLSEQFKERARARLTENFGKEELLTDVEEQELKAFTLNTPKRSRAKTAIAAGSAAAVLALGVWGVGALHSRNVSPFDGQTADSGAAAHTAEATEEPSYIVTGEETQEQNFTETREQTEETEQVIVIDEGGKLVSNTITFPAHELCRTEYNSEILDVLPFNVSIELPENWEIVLPDDTEGMAAMSPMYIMADGRQIATIDYNTYEIYPEAVGQPNYYRMVYNQLMLGSMVTWDCEYTPVAQTESSQNACCQIMYRNRTTGETSYSDGILAYNDDLQCYVQIAFAYDISDMLQHYIAESIMLEQDGYATGRRIAEGLTDIATLYTDFLPVEYGFTAHEYDGGTVLLSCWTDEKALTRTAVHYIRGGWLQHYSMLTEGSFEGYAFEETDEGLTIKLLGDINVDVPIKDGKLLNVAEYAGDYLGDSTPFVVTTDVSGTSGEERLGLIGTAIANVLIDEWNSESSAAPQLYVSAEGIQYAPCVGANSWSAPDNADYDAPDVMEYWENGLITEVLPYDVDELKLLLPEGASIVEAYYSDRNGSRTALSYAADIVKLPPCVYESAVTLALSCPEGFVEYHLLREADPTLVGESLPEPPELYIIANGEPFKTAMGSSMWTYNGQTLCIDADVTEPPVIPDSQWIGGVQVQLPDVEGAEVESVSTSMDEYGRDVYIICYPDGRIDFPDGARQGNVYTITVRYPQGTCTYSFATEDVDTMPPSLYIQEEGEQARNLYMADYTWTYLNKGESVTNSEFACGYEVDPITVGGFEINDRYYFSKSKKLRLLTVDGGVVTAITCHSEDGATQKSVGVDEEGYILFPVETIGDAYTVTVEYENGFCNYYFFTK